MRSQLLDFNADFAVVIGNSRSQAAVMIIAPGDAEGGPDNRHRGADQWLYAVSGEGHAVVDGTTLALGMGTLLLIERGEQHEPLRTLNFYVPPAYDNNGEPLPRGESG